MVFENKLFLGLILILLISVTPVVMAEEEDEEEREDVILSKFSSDQHVLDGGFDMWEDLPESEFDSSWDHEIEIKSFNNGKDIFFFISWEDDTKSVDKNPDGLSLILETKRIEKPMIFKVEEDEEEYETHEDIIDTQVTINEESLVWQADDTTSNEIVTNAEWANDRWNVIIQRKGIVSEIGEIEMGKKIESFLEIAVWDGNKGQSSNSLEKEEVPELELLVLPEINSYPKDIYVWSTIIAVGTGSFFISEIKKHQKVKT